MPSSLYDRPVYATIGGMKYSIPAIILALAILTACDGPSLPIPPTPTPGSFSASAAHSHSHGGGGPDEPLFTRYGGDVAVTLSTSPDRPQPNSPTRITYTLTSKDGTPLIPDKLMVTHDRLMHLIVVSRDLGYFAHLHPLDVGGGRYSITNTLPAPGSYILFNEFYTAEGKAQIERDVLSVGGVAQDSADPALPQTLGVPQQVDGLTAVLSASARKIPRRSSTSFKLSVTRDGKPAADLEPFLGAPAHVVIVSADTKQFAHTHADVPGGAMSVSGDMAGMNKGSMAMPTPPARFGPDLLFTHTFMQPGPYRIWVQFGHTGKVVTFDFNVQVYK